MTAPPESPRPANVIEALARVIAEMPAVGKDQEMTEGQRYRYRSIEAIVDKASDLFGRYGLVPMPHRIKRAVREVQMGSGRTVWTEDSLRVKYRIYGPGGINDFVDTAWFVALARDNSDKGTNKAMTQAYKQMLTQVCMVADNGEDPDTYHVESEWAEQPKTADDIAVEKGWDSRADFETAKDAVREAIKARYDSATGAELWSQYQRPDADRPARMRTRAEHDKFLGLHLADPEPSATPDPESSRPPENLPDSPGDPDWKPSYWPSPADLTACGWEMPEHNDHRGHGDDLYTRKGVRGLEVVIDGQPDRAVADQLRARGVRVSTAWTPAVRKFTLEQVIVENNPDADGQGQASSDDGDDT